MGQGYSLTTLSAGSAGIDVPELSDLAYEKSLGNARFMKCIRARHKDGLVVAKVVMKPYASLRLGKYVSTMREERDELAGISNALGFHRIFETSTNGYLVRQYIHGSLYDRMSTRPFLEDIEKKWLAFQLLCAVRDCHAKNIHHGDIKTENILVTSWNWLYLCDFSSSFKPTYLPEDNPADFSFFFDTSGRRTCYLAPERFVRSGEDATGKGPINWAMDIFSVGCVIAELFLESPIFSLSQLFKYRSNKEYDPVQIHFNRISDKDIRDMVAHMIQVDPQARYSADEYLNFWKNKAFPDYFYNFLHQYMYLITDPTSGRRPLTAGTENLGEADDRIDRVYNDFDKISYFLGYGAGEKKKVSVIPPHRIDTALFPLQIDIPNNRHEASTMNTRTVDDGSLIFLTLVVSSLRSTARAASRIRACELLLAFSERVTDEAKLDRILPYLVALLTDKTDAVKVAALRSITQLLALVHVVSPINAYIFPEYLLPKFEIFVPGLAPRSERRAREEPSGWVRATYASCLASLATTALKFLDIIQALRAGGSLPANDPEAEDGVISQSIHQQLYDVARDDLVLQFEQQTKAFLTDKDPVVRRAFLGSVSTLCVFFGSPKASDVILSHLNTYLNENDWQLKCAFLETIIGVATFVGSSSLEEYILPLMIQALTDPEESVVERVLRSFSAIARLGLFQRPKTWELVDIVGRFLVHPNLWIREAAAQFMASAVTYLSLSDRHSVVIPLIRPYLKMLPSQITELSLLDALKKPIPRLVFDMVLVWASKAERGLFWRPVQQQGAFSFGATRDMIPIISGKDLSPKSFSRIPKNDEDDGWLQRIRAAGLTEEDELKLLSLREYIWRVAQRKKQEESEGEEASVTGMNRILALKDLKIAPQTVFFDSKQNLFQAQPEQKNGSEMPRTIAEALRDASTPAHGLHRRLQKTTLNELPIGLNEQSSAQASQGIGVKVSDRSNTDEREHTEPSGMRSREFGSVDSGSAKAAEHTYALQRKGSAISLVSRTDMANKAAAETSTTPTNAFGKIEGAFGREASSKKPSPLAPTKDSHQNRLKPPLHHAVHTYSGHDPSVLKLLDSLYLDNYPMDMVEFGPLITPSKRRTIQRASGQQPGHIWRPEGTLVAMLGEHTAAVNRILIAPDHAFFITGSDDGTVKVWDTARLERNVTHRSRLTHKHASGVKVTSLAFIENTHSIVSTGSDGSIHIVKVDFAESHGGTRYGKLKILRDYHISSDDNHFVTWCEHFKADAQSILLCATNKSRLVAIELRTMSILYDLGNPVHHGVPTCFCVDKRHHWLLLGTSHGVLDLWDLRFHIRLKSWAFVGGSPVHRICLSPGRSSRRNRVTIAGGTNTGEITTWDLEKGSIREVFRTGVVHASSSNNPKDHHLAANKTPRLIELDDHRQGTTLSRYVFQGATAGFNVSSGTLSSDQGVKAVIVGAHYPEDGADPRHFFALSAGPDWKVRYWDPSRAEASCVVSGLDFEEGRPTYALSHPNQDLTIVIETLSPPADSARPDGPSRSGSAAASPSSRSERGKKDGSSSRKSQRSSIISLQQQHLMKRHLDVIEDVALLEFPYGMVVSCDRAGMVYVFS